MNSVPDSEQQIHKFDWLIGTVLAVITLGIYFSTLAPTVLEADSGEFQFVAWLPGIAHPTGYPLYTLLGWLWTHLFPIGEVAWRMNLLSAIFAAITIALTYLVTRRVLDLTLPYTQMVTRRMAAITAAVTFAVSHTFWSQAIIAEVYALHALFVAAILWLTLKTEPGQHRFQLTSTSALLALVFGLALTHHVTIVLLSPALLLFLATKYLSLEQKPALSQLIIWLGAHLILLLFPLALYLYLPFIAPATPYIQLHLSESQTLTLYDNSLLGFWQHITGAVFSDALQPETVGLERLQMIWALLRQQVGWLGVGLALAGLTILWQQHQQDILLLTGLNFLSIATFNLIYFIGDVFVLFIPAWFFICIWLGIGISGATDWAAKRLVRRKTASEEIIFERMQTRLGQSAYRLMSLGLPIFFFALPLYLLISQQVEISQRSNISARTKWQEILDYPLPEGAILISNDRNEIMPMWYYQYVEGRRPDLLGLFPLIVNRPGYANVGRVLDQALSSDRQIYLIKPMAGLELKASIRPEGKLFRVSAQNDTPFYPSNLLLPKLKLVSVAGEQLSETIKLLGYDLLSGTKISPGEAVDITLYWQTVQELSLNYTSYIHLVDSAGQTITQSDHRPGGIFYPSSHWQTGEVLRDRHTLSIPANALAGLHQLRVGVYYQTENGLIESMGSGVEIGPLVIKDADNPLTSPAFNLSHTAQSSFGDVIFLLGYDIVPTDDNQLLVTFTWQAKQRSSLNWTIFIHLMDNAGNIVAQADGQPRGGSYPTKVWDIGEVVSDPHVLFLPDNLAGEYQLIFGLYNANTGERLDVTNDNGQFTGDHLNLNIIL